MCTAPWSHPTHGVIKCGQCMECRLAYSREWAIRITHEAQMHDRNCFLTLTYDDDHLQKFFKRLRHHFEFKYVACGEYGERRRRPHFMRLSSVLTFLMIVLSTALVITEI